MYFDEEEKKKVRAIQALQQAMSELCPKKPVYIVMRHACWDGCEDHEFGRFDYKQDAEKVAEVLNELRKAETDKMGFVYYSVVERTVTDFERTFWID